MTKNKIDIHGVTLDRLPKILDTIIIDALIKEAKQVKVITGTGILQKTLIDKCKILYGYTAEVSFSNPGEVVISLED